MPRRIAVYPATLDPIHNGHIDIAVRAANVFDEVVVAVYDAAAAYRNKKNLLFTVEERVALAERAFAGVTNIRVAPFSGLLVNYAQDIGAIVVIRGLRVFSDFEFEFRLALANKKLAPNVETISIIADEQHLHISSSTIREIAELGGDVSTMVPPFVNEALIQRFTELHANQSSPGYSMSIRD